MARKAKGLGDTIEQITEATGIKAAVELFSKATGLDCGCDARKEKLNEMFPYKKTQCLNEKDYNYLKNFFDTPKNELSIQEQLELGEVYMNVFGVNLQMSSCASCWRDYISQLKRIYDLY